MCVGGRSLHLVSLFILACPFPKGEKSYSTFMESAHVAFLGTSGCRQQTYGIPPQKGSIEILALVLRLMKVA